MAKKLPSRFNKYGLLPPGDYDMTLRELEGSMLVKGPIPQPPNWDDEWRKKLVNNLKILVKELWHVGIEEIFVDGTFVTDKDHPGDIDGYFPFRAKSMDLAKSMEESRELVRKLNLINTHKAWNWDIKSLKWDLGSDKYKLPMWHIYRVELFPDWGQPSGIKDEFGNNLTFHAAFRKTKDNQPKGIVRIERD